MTTGMSEPATETVQPCRSAAEVCAECLSAPRFFIESDLIDSLAAPTVFFRLFSIEQVIRYGSSERVHRKLSERIDAETDLECQRYLAHALHVVELRLRKPSPQTTPVGQTEEIATTYSNGSPDVRLSILSTMQGEVAKSLASEGGHWLEGEVNPLIQYSLIRAFYAYWSEWNLDKIQSFIDSDSFPVRWAALEALTLRQPNKVKTRLADLLTSEDQANRFLGLLSLSLIDPEVTVQHLEPMILGADSSSQTDALLFCRLLNFPRVRDLLLTFLEACHPIPLIEQAGTFFRRNPDPEVPFRIGAIIEKAPSAEIPVLEGILNGAMETLKTSGAIPRFEDFSRNLAEWFSRRGAQLLVRQKISRLADLDLIMKRIENEAGLLEYELSQAMHRPFVTSSLQEAHQLPYSARVKKRIEGILFPKPDAAHPSDLDSNRSPRIADLDQERGFYLIPEHWGRFFELPLEGQLRFLGLLQLSDREKAGPLFKIILSKKDTLEEVQAAALSAAGRVENPEFLALAESWLGSANELLIAHALDYIGRFSCQTVAPKVDDFLKRGGPQLKAAALRILQKTDPAKAASQLLVNLRDPHPQVQRIALNGLLATDFALIREDLTDFLMTEGGRRFIPTTLCLYQTDPDPESVYSLFRLEKKMPVEEVGPVKTARNWCFEMLHKSGRMKEMTVEDLEKDLEKRWSQENTRKKVPVPPYSPRDLDWNRESPRTAFDRGYDELVPLAKSVTQAVIVLSLAGLIFLMTPAVPPESPIYRLPAGAPASMSLPVTPVASAPVNPVPPAASGSAPTASPTARSPLNPPPIPKKSKDL